jgi:putative membrane protein
MQDPSALQGWEAGGHALSGSWLALASELVRVLLVIATAVLLVRAFLRRGRYRATGVLGEEDLRAIHAALASAEKKTIGEILPVVLERSDRHPSAGWLAALVAALVGSVGLAPWLPWDRPALLLLAQLGLGALGYLGARLLPDFQRFFVSTARAAEVAEEQAFQEFHRYELHRTRAQSGVLLFVSLLERRVVVLADTGIDARVRPEHWNRTTELVLDGIRRGSLSAGLVSGIHSAGEVLAEHFPAMDGDPNEIPDRVIVRKE